MNNHSAILFNDISTYLESKQNFKGPNLYINKANSIDRKKCYGPLVIEKRTQLFQSKYK